jgi:hypothetical protein
MLKAFADSLSVTGTAELSFTCFILQKTVISLLVVATSSDKDI